MGKKNDFVFLVDEEFSIITRTIDSLLEKDGYSPGKCNIGLTDLMKIQTLPYVFVVESELLMRYPEVRMYLNDLCIKNAGKIAVIGDKEDNAGVASLMAATVISRAFVMPVSNSAVVEELKNLVDSLRDENGKKSILVVDDNPMFLRLAMAWFKDSYDVNICPSAMAAFHMIETKKPDLILLDYEMPVCDGAQFLEMLHSEPSTADIPVMFLTSKGDAETVKNLISLKPQGYLLKNQTKERTLKYVNQFFFGGAE